MRFKDLDIGIKFAVVTGAVIGALALGFGLPHFCAQKALKKAEDQTAKGYGALAAETIDCYRHRLAKDEKTSCGSMLGIYRAARRWDRLEWVSQVCLEISKESNIAGYLSLGDAWSNQGRGQEALGVFQAAAARFEKESSPWLAIYQVLRQAKQNDGALEALNQALKRSPENLQILGELAHFHGFIRSKWADAKPYAEKLAQSETIEAKLIAARVFMKTGDQARAATLVAAARTAFEKNPEAAAPLEKTYSDVLAGKK